MGFFDLFRRSSPTPAAMVQQWTSWQLPDAETVLGMSSAELWRTQPHLRTVVNFVARNISQLGLHTFVRQGETDRVRDRSGPLAALLSRPNAQTTAYELVYGLVADLALYDCAYWAVWQDQEAPSGWTLNRLPPNWVTAVNADVLTVSEYRVRAPGAQREVVLPAGDVL
ncbi:phage portal protein, partial [Lysinibacillus sp. NPDC056185]|uniref:phage portal protein n=1 Tax=Lysinibacillus sp. NPDC056185 TaxID=3345739 RepID=UPI0039EF7789